MYIIILIKHLVTFCQSLLSLYYIYDNDTCTLCINNYRYIQLQSHLHVQTYHKWQKYHGSRVRPQNAKTQKRDVIICQQYQLTEHSERVALAQMMK